MYCVSLRPLLRVLRLTQAISNHGLNKVSRKTSPITEGLPSADTQRMELSCFAGVIPAERLDLISKRAADDGLE